MQPAPNTIDAAQVLYSSPLDARHRPTGACRHTVAGHVPPPFAALAICQYPGDTGYYLFYCDEHWTPVTDTWHATPADAMHQAESEYEGVSSTWHRNQA